MEIRFVFRSPDSGTALVHSRKTCIMAWVLCNRSTIPWVEQVVDGLLLFYRHLVTCTFSQKQKNVQWSYKSLVKLITLIFSLQLQWCYLGQNNNENVLTTLQGNNLKYIIYCDQIFVITLLKIVYCCDYSLLLCDLMCDLFKINVMYWCKPLK